MAKLLEELMVMRKWEMETMILRLDPHGFGLFPTIMVLVMMAMIYDDFDDNDRNAKEIQ